jgi:hypothetical protein
MAKDRQQIERCLAVVQAYEASGKKAGEWAAANGISIGDLSSWCAHAQRWRVRLNKPGAGPGLQMSPTRFVAATVAASSPASVRVELPVATATVTLHWPMSHAPELASWLREAVR